MGNLSHALFQTFNLGQAKSKLTAAKNTLTVAKNVLTVAMLDLGYTGNRVHFSYTRT